MKRKMVSLLLWVLITKSFLYGQVNFYLHIPNQEDVPKVYPIENTTEYKIESKNSSINNIFAEHRITKFQKAFPHAKTKFLQEIYEVACDDSTLMKHLRMSHSEKFPIISEIPKEELCFTPNDFGGTGGIVCDQSYLEFIRAREAWGITTGDPNLLLGITDTYFDLAHQDLQGKIVQIYGSNTLPGGDDNFINHGTVTSGTLAGATNNGIGISSMGFNCKIIASSRWANYDELIMLSQQGARVINASWGHYGDPQNDPIRQSVINEIYGNGTLIVAAAGNEPITLYHIPASLNHVLSVSSVGHMNDPGYYLPPPDGRPYNWKDRVEAVPGDASSTDTHNDSVDIAAPGFAISALKISNSYYNHEIWGTSIAAPQVVATCGLMLSINPCLTPNDLIRIIKQTAVNIYGIPENYNYNGQYGAGRLDAYTAVCQAGEEGIVHYSNIILNNSNLSKVGISLDNNVTMTGSNNLTVRYEVIIGQNFNLTSGSSLTIEANPSSSIDCQ